MSRRQIAVTLLGAAALGASAAPALAAPTALFGNTLQITLGEKSGKFYVDQNGTYTQAKADGSTASGTWAERGDKFCVTQTAPQPKQEHCIPAITHGVGDSWTVPWGAAGDMHLTIVKGRS